MGALAFAIAVVAAAAASAQTVLTPVQLLSDPGYTVGNFSVSMADSAIVFDVHDQALPEREDVWLVPRTGNQGDNLSQTSSSMGELALAPSWSPAGQYLAYIFHVELPADQSQIVVQAQTTMTITPSSLHVRKFTWAVDGVSLAFSAFADGQGINVYTAFLDGSHLQQITHCTGTCTNPQCNQQDDVIAYETDENGMPQIALVNFNGTSARPILSNAKSPMWSPNTGELLTYVCGTDVCVANEDGSNPRNLTSGALGLQFSSPSFSLDESSVAFLGSPSGATTGDIFVVTLANGQMTRWTATGDASGPQFSPVESSILYVCHRADGADLCILTGPAGGATGGFCDTSNCAGCCMNGLCYPGNSDLACRGAGLACQACAAGTACDPIAGACTALTGSCNQTPCAGCCDASGVCRTGIETSACGLDGQNCVACGAPTTCAPSGVCKAPPVSCGPNNCTGCCDSSNVCRAGNQPSFCGARGSSCSTCGSGQICDQNTGLCVAPTCSAANCAGCCSATGQCLAGISDSACGGNGLTCLSCSGSTHCAGSRICLPTASCGPSTCPGGCCDSAGTCQPGTSAAACGSGSFSCMPCSSAGQTCDLNMRKCVSPSICSPSNCQGCCDPGTSQCRSGVTDAACGSDGFSCRTCTGSTHCDPETLFCD